MLQNKKTKKGWHYSDYYLQYQKKGGQYSPDKWNGALNYLKESILFLQHHGRLDVLPGVVMTLESEPNPVEEGVLC